MNTINKTSQTLTAIIITVITACLISCDDRKFGDYDKNNNNTSPNFVFAYNHNNNFEVLNDGERILTDQQIERIGQLHNEVCMNIVDNLKVNDSTYDVINELFKEFKGTNCNLAKLPEGISFIKYSDAMLAYNVPTEVIEFLDTTLNYVDENYEKVEDISHYVECRKDTARNKFKGINLDIVLTGLTVLKSSARLWSDKSDGGLGYFVKLFNNSDTSAVIYNLSQDQKDKIKAVLKADMGAACLVLAVGIVVAAIEVVTCGAATLAAGAVEAIVVEVGGHAAFHSVLEIVDIVNQSSKSPANISPLAIRWNRNYEYSGLLVGNPF